MREDVWVEGGQRERENRRPVAERFARRQENYQRKRYGQEAG